MATILDEIVRYKTQFVAECTRKVPLDVLESQARARAGERTFARTLRRPGGPNLIAEVKKASPSRGVIRADFDPVQIASIYASNGACALSVLTDEKYFQGSAGVLMRVREVTDLPILRKDFTIDPYQICEAKVIGADAVLLIVGILSAARLKDYIDTAHSLNLDALVEVHTEHEVEVALSAGALLIGINNRDLRTFRTDLRVTERLIGRIPRDVAVVSESGINTREDVIRLGKAGAHAVLVGESLMREPDVGLKLRELLGHG